MRTLATVAALFCSLFATSAVAATLIVESGSAAVNRGTGFAAAGSGTSIGPGDRVLVGRGGSATIVYSPTCRVQVGAGQAATVLQAIPCVSGTHVVSFDYVIGSAALATVISGAVVLSKNGHSP